jgi:hypothetical protein
MWLNAAATSQRSGQATQAKNAAKRCMLRVRVSAAHAYGTSDAVSVCQDFGLSGTII